MIGGQLFIVQNLMQYTVFHISGPQELNTSTSHPPPALWQPNSLNTHTFSSATLLHSIAYTMLYENIADFFLFSFCRFHVNYFQWIKRSRGQPQLQTFSQVPLSY